MSRKINLKPDVVRVSHLEVSSGLIIGEKLMLKKSTLGTLLMSMFLISGCSTMAPGTKIEQVVERNGVSLELIPASYREVYFSPASSDERHCRAPGPDFTVQQSDQLNLSLPANGGESLGGGENQTGLSLGGRTPIVLITRELMYRACELSANINANGETSVAIYATFIQAIKDITQQQSGSGTASSSNSAPAPAYQDSSSDESDSDDDNYSDDNESDDDDSDDDDSDDDDSGDDDSGDDDSGDDN
ncbi:MAG: hypothetical protein ACI8Y3_000493 [Paraglaciecola sp.]|jgi:hypothetical protein